MATILDRFADAQFHQDWDQLRTRLGDDARPDLLEHAHAQRRADALYAIFIAAATREPGSGAVPEPLVDIVITEAVYDAALTAMETGTPFRPPSPAPARSNPADRSRPMRPWWVTRLCCGRVLSHHHRHPHRPLRRRHRLAHRSRPPRRHRRRRGLINFGRRRRCVTSSARDAAVLQAALDRNGRCLWPGCRLTHYQIDHTNPWNHHGVSDVANTGPACAKHNRLKTRGYTTWRDHHGHWHTTRPDGTPIQPV